MPVDLEAPPEAENESKDDESNRSPDPIVLP